MRYSHVSVQGQRLLDKCSHLIVFLSLKFIDGHCYYFDRFGSHFSWHIRILFENKILRSISNVLHRGRLGNIGGLTLTRGFVMSFFRASSSISFPLGILSKELDCFCDTPWSERKTIIQYILKFKTQNVQDDCQKQLIFEINFKIEFETRIYFLPR